MTRTNEIIEKFNKFVIPTYNRFPICPVKGKGSKLWDADGNVYLDFISGIAVNSLGHCHPEVTKAIQQQCAELVHVSNLYNIEKQALLAETLSGLALGGKCFFCNSGAEANETLIKMARLRGNPQGKHEIITMKNSFHGRTLGTLAATGQEKIQDGFDPVPEGFKYAEYNNLESVKALVNEKTCAILVEAIQGEGGIVPATPEFITGLRAICDEHDLLLLCDEVQSGIGRTGRWFGFQNYDIEPDAFSLAKALGNGFPIGAVVTNAKASDILQPGKHASTFGGTPLASAVALAVIKVIKSENLLDNVNKSSAKLLTGLNEMATKYSHIKEIRGKGLMLGIVLDESAAPIVNRLMEIGLLSIATAGNVIRLLPPLNISNSEIEEALDMLDDVLAEWHGLPSEFSEDSNEPETTD
ncbi:MAG: aspartate aminotransferase family protein [Lentisphaerae bacterium]|nr:aspartate aminotransferase family protein [Lentisphaerota bacterium]